MGHSLSQSTPILTRQVEVLSVVEISAVEKDKAIRLTNALMAIANSAQKGSGPTSRVDTVYNEVLGHLKIILIGTLQSNFDFLRIVEVYTE